MHLQSKIEIHCKALPFLQTNDQFKQKTLKCQRKKNENYFVCKIIMMINTTEQKSLWKQNITEDILGTTSCKKKMFCNCYMFYQ